MTQPPSPDADDALDVENEQHPAGLPPIQPRPLQVFSLHTIAPLAPASVLGVLARLGILYLGTYSGQSAFSLAWVQAAGCFVMGLCIALRDPITATYQPLYLALTTGFCGSLTTFSGWQLDVFLAWANKPYTHKHTIHTIVDGLTLLAFTFGLSLAALQFGVHIASSVSATFSIKPHPLRPSGFVTILCLCTFLATIPAFVLLPKFDRFVVCSALLYSYPGTLLRYTLGTKLNNPRFPYGTFAANVLGTALLAAFYVLRSSSVSTNFNACIVIQGLSDGLCGCLTTVSTFAAEIRAANSKTAWTYTAASVLAAQLVCVLVLVPAWSTHAIFDTVRCLAHGSEQD
ncbi:CrcB-like protein-domain-containing protein [Auriculariales sp. MPI-PUGE-AT-0066]|nr:CrcB-like protein-domain-containing protein [Auriculariales sp. MPI-PUGE-AT-0066]